MLAILADDMTGALDSAAPFAGRGLRTEVALAPSAIQMALAKKPEVLAINLASRELTLEEARDLSAQILATLPLNTIIFKKIDSRLKGNIKAELDSFTFHKALVAPAIPEFERVVKNGHLQGFGVEYPISIAACLGDHADKALIPDIITDEDMDMALDTAKATGVDLFVGARGLADAIARQMTKHQHSKRVQLPQGKVLLIIGSRDPITLHQIDNLLENMQTNYIKAPNGVIHSVDQGSIKTEITLVQATEANEICSGQQVSKNLAVSVHPALTLSAKTLLMCGGETANAVMQEMQIDHFQLLGECLPGLAVAYYGNHCLIAKSGGFGDPETFIHLAKQTSGDGAKNEN